MASYEEKKKIALGFTLPAPDLFQPGNSDFDISPRPEMRSSGFIENFGKVLEIQIKEQVRYKASLELWDEYEADNKTAGKNLAELNKLLLAGEAVKLESFFTRKPVADWLNYIFHEESELNELIENMKAASLECRAVVVAAIEKELKRLVNFKTLFEEIINLGSG
jgi:hypothetical protein